MNQTSATLVHYMHKQYWDETKIKSLYRSVYIEVYIERKIYIDLYMTSKIIL